MSSKIISILIISTNAIGDTFLSYSAINSIKQSYPKAKISILINEESSILLPLYQFKDIFILKSKSIYSILHLLNKIRKIKFDFALNFFPGRINSLFLLWGKAEIKAGFTNFKKIKDWYNISQEVHSNLSSKEFKIWQFTDSYLYRIKIVLDAAKFSCGNISKYEIDNLVPKLNPTENIVIHPFSKIKNRSISIDQLNTIIKYCLDNYCGEIILIGGNELIRILHNVSGVNNKLVHLKIGEPILNLIQLINSSNLFIAIDSFPIHLADSLNCNFIGLFGPTNPKSVLVNSEKSIFFDVQNFQNISGKKIIESIDNYIHK